MRDELAAALNLSQTDSGGTPEKEPAPIVTADEQADTATVEEPPAEAAKEADPALEAPQHWPADERTRFEELPRATQEWLLTRSKNFEADITRKSTELAKQRKEVEEFNQVLEPYRQQLELAGTTPYQAVQRLFAAQQFLDKDPAAALKWLAESYRVDLSGLSLKGDEAFVDPTVKSLRDELNSLKQMLQQDRTQVNQTKAQEAQRIISEFRDAKAGDGSPKYPYFDQLESLMAPLVARGKTLEEAYEATSYTLPEVRERVAAEVAKTAKAEALRKAEEERKLKAEKAKPATQVIRSKGTSTDEPTRKAGQSVRDDLEAAFAALTAGRI